MPRSAVHFMPIAGTYDSFTASLKPVGWWKLNEPAGATAAHDSSGNGNTLTAYGMVTFGEAGHIPSNASVLYDGSSGYLASAPQSSGALYTTFSGDFSIVMWTKFTSSATIQRLLGFGANATNEAVQLFYLPNALSFGFTSDDVNSSVTPSTTAWGMTVATFTHASKTQSLYYNDSFQLSRTASAAPAIPTNNAFMIGQWQSGYYFSGYMAEVAVFNYVLSQGQISYLYTAGS